MYISLLCLTLFEAIHIYYTYPCDMCTYLFIIFDIVLEQPKPQHLPVPPAWQPGSHSLASLHRPRRRCTASSGRSQLRRRRRSAKGEWQRCPGCSPGSPVRYYVDPGCCGRRGLAATPTPLQGKDRRWRQRRRSCFTQRPSSLGGLFEMPRRLLRRRRFLPRDELLPDLNDAVGGNLRGQQCSPLKLLPCQTIEQ